VVGFVNFEHDSIIIDKAKRKLSEWPTFLTRKVGYISEEYGLYGSTWENTI